MIMMSIGGVENNNGHRGIKSLLGIYHTCKLTRDHLKRYITSLDLTWIMSGLFTALQSGAWYRSGV